MLDAVDQQPPHAPCVSIILPTFNRLKFLAATIDSIRQQSFTDWELLIADDGSGPELRAYLKQLENPPQIRVLWLAHSGNLSAVRNAAMHEARGDYVAFIDSDDVWPTEKLEVQMQSLRRHVTRDWSYTGFTFVDEGGIPLDGHRVEACPAIAGHILDALIRAEAVLVQSSVIVRRSLLAKVGGYDASIYLCGDYELWMRLAQESEVDFIDQPLVRVRRHREHCGSDVAALEDLALILKRMQRSNRVPHLHTILQRRRATVSSNLARSHSISGDQLAVLGTLLHDASFSWRYWHWWNAGVRSTARVFAPAAIVNVLRTYLRKFA
jgi:glycosyltransferase involved in cell wall biosynthesis